MRIALAAVAAGVCLFTAGCAHQSVGEFEAWFFVIVFALIGVGVLIAAGRR